MQKTTLERPTHQLRPMPKTQFPHDPSPLRLNSTNRHLQLPRHITIRMPIRKHHRRDAFPLRQLHLIKHEHSVVAQTRHGIREFPDLDREFLRGSCGWPLTPANPAANYGHRFSESAHSSVPIRCQVAP
jgi:hypothetical protein